MIGLNDLTPVEEREGIYLKREDLFAPFGAGGVNGGKLRQCWCLVEKVKDEYEGLISCCSIYSPQAPITAAVGEYYGMPVTIYYGATTQEKLAKLRMPSIARKHGARLEIASKSGIHSILYGKAREFAAKNNYYVVDYGFNLSEFPEILVDRIAAQVQNIPDVDNLVVTCGSGITASSILVGLAKYNKHVDHVYLVATAPDRKKFITETLREYGAWHSFEIVDLFHSKGFVYEHGVNAEIGGIKLHPNYEAKTYAWLKNAGLKGDTLLWIVGSKPMR